MQTTGLKELVSFSFRQYASDQSIYYIVHQLTSNILHFFEHLKSIRNFIKETTN